MQNPPEEVVAEGHAVYVHSCVMVFGSEHGGGRCIFGGYNGHAGTAVDSTHNPKCGDHFLRTGSDYGVGNGIFQAKIEGSGKNATTNLYETWVNGTSVICTNTPMSGSWDVISFHTDKAGGDGRAFRNIGCPDDTTKAGGQDYAEFLVYSNKLTTAERMILEHYLASKWGLTGKQAATAGTITLGAGGTVVGSLPGIVGTGTWTLGANDYADGGDGRAGAEARVQLRGFVGRVGRRPVVHVRERHVHARARGGGCRSVVPVRSDSDGDDGRRARGGRLCARGGQDADGLGCGGLHARARCRPRHEGEARAHEHVARVARHSFRHHGDLQVAVGIELHAMTVTPY